MSCAACSARVEKAASSVSGVENCNVNLLTGTMQITGVFSENEVIGAIEKAGYGCKPENAEMLLEKASSKANNDVCEKASSSLLTKLILSLAFLAVLMYFSMGYNMLGLPLPSFFDGNPIASALVQMLCSAAVMIIGNRFFISGTKSLMRFSPNMDALVAIGSGASFVYSTAVLFIMTARLANGDIAGAETLLHDLYFESAAMILALVSVGKTLEARSKVKTGDALRALKNLAPENARVIREGKEMTVSLREVAVGDIFIVRPGEQIPADGYIIEGSSAIDQSAVNGESVPAEKSIGDNVIGATLNTSGFIKCRATGVGSDTVLSKIIETVSDASATKAPIAKTADKVAAVFVPCVMAVAAVTALIWLILGKDFGFALARAVSVLVISCPCSLGLATPVAIMVGSGVGAKNGILFRNAGIMELCGKIKTVILDKTGTVTSGNISVSGVYPSEESCTSELLCVAFALESKSEHPLAKAVSEYCSGKNISAFQSENFKADVGSGVSGTVDGRSCLGGKAEYLLSNGIDIPECEQNKAREIALSGSTPLFFASEKKLLGIIACSDTLRKDSPAAVEMLGNMGIETVLLSGDNAVVTDSVAKKAGIAKAIAEASPQSKAETVKAYTQKGTTAMAGDGINDAPALAVADVGIAIGSGTDIAKDTAGVILLGNGLTSLVNTVKLSKAVLRNIKQNLFWAFFYNCIGIPIAAGVLVPLGIVMNPMTGALAMGLSSFCVVSNALRLNTFKAWHPVLTECDSRENTTEECTCNNCISKPVEEKIMEKVFNVTGMMCHHCENHVKKALEAIDGVELATAVYTEGKVTVQLSKDVDDATIIKAITDEGYEVGL